MANIPEKIIQQRLKLQLESLESPSELPGGFRYVFIVINLPELNNIVDIIRRLMKRKYNLTNLKDFFNRNLNCSWSLLSLQVVVHISISGFDNA